MARVGKRAQGYRLAGQRPAGERRSATSASAVPQAAGGGGATPEATVAVAATVAEPRARPVKKKRRRRRSAWASLGTWITTASTLITSLAAIAALLFTGLSLQQTREQNQLAESGQITDRFNAAVTNLGSGTQTIRIGGIYALQRIMQDSSRDQPAVVQVLAAFVREEAPLTGAPEPRTAGGAPAVDVQAALTVLATRQVAADGGALIDLDSTDLVDADLYGAHLDGADLYGAKLDGADLNNAHLDGADLTKAGLVGGGLIDANLTDANLSGADFGSANLTDAILRSADLTNANFSGSYLFNAKLDLARLDGARFRGADLTVADLSGTSWCAGGKPARPGGYVCYDQ